MSRIRLLSFIIVLIGIFCVSLAVNAQQNTSPPIISGFSPQIVDKGQQVIITGTNLGERVQFFDRSGRSAASVNGLLTEDNSKLIVEVPTTIQPGEYGLSVYSQAGQGDTPQTLKVKEGGFDPSVRYDDVGFEPPTSLGDMIQSVYNYSFQILGLVIFIMFVWAGFMWLTAGGNPGAIGKARSKMTSAILGGVLLMSSYLILNTINPDLVDTSYILPGIKIEKPAALPPSQASSTAQTAAQNLINAIGLSRFSTSGDCGANFNARQNIQDIAAGRYPAVCSYDCRSRQPIENRCPAGGPNGNITVNPALLDGLTRLWRDRSLRFTVTSLTTGVHSRTSAHYGGNAVDIVPADSQGSVWIEARGALKSYGGNAICEDISDPDNDQAPGAIDDPDCRSSAMHHIHWVR